MSTKYHPVAIKFFSIILIVMLAIAALPLSSVQADASTTFPGTATDVDNNTSDPDDYAWIDLTNLAANDTAYASVDVPPAEYSHYLYATNFGFAIPDDAVISGIQVTVRRIVSGDVGLRIRDHTVYLLKDGVQVGNNLGDTATSWYRNVADKAYGNSIEMWGTTWTPAEVNDPDFGVAISVFNASSTENRTASIDSIQISVAYNIIESTLTAADVAGVYGEYASISATLLPAASGKQVTFVLNSGPGCAAQTNASGVATCNARMRSDVGEYATGVYASFAGDAYYTPSSGTASLTVTARPITVTAATETKDYDGTAASTGAPTITSGSLYTANGDTAAWTQSFDSANVGTGKTITPSGSIDDGNSGNNYSVTFAPVTDGVIVARPITVTAVTDSKAYDGATASSGTPTITEGTLLEGDTASWSQAFDNRNAGTGKTITPSGAVSDGNDGGNYNVTLIPVTTGEITARAITVSAVSDSKAYDRTTSSSAAPSITSGELASGDTADFTQAFDSANVGTGKTLTPSGSVSDGNSGNNYSVTFVNATDGAITARPITVTAATDSKAYDRTTASSAAPSITSGSLLSGDTAAWTQVFDSANVGTGKTLTPSGSVSDGNGGSNYTITFASVTDGVIVARPITVTAAADSKAYDGTATSSATPSITSGSLLSGDTASFSQAFANRNVGTSKTITPSGSVSDGNGGGNYSVTFAPVTTGVITARPITVTAVTASKTYDGTTTAAGTPIITSGALVNGDSASFSQVFDTRDTGTSKTITPSGSIDDGNSGNNYTVTFAPVSTGTITARPITVSAVTASKIYNGTTASSGTPIVTSGSLGSGDTASFSQVFDTRNTGTGKTITPSGSVSDGNGGNNYTVTFAPVTTGEITARPITVSAVTASKIYNGTTSAAGTPTITSGALVNGDSAAWTQAFDTRDAGTGKTITPSGAVSDGNGGNNYAVTFAPVTDGEITALPITVSAVTASKTYDGTAAAAGTPSITSGALVNGDSASFSQAFANRNVGSGKTITPSGTISDGNGGGNYSVTFASITDGVIVALPITVSAVSETKAYDGTSASSAAPAITSGALVNGDTAGFSQAFDSASIGAGKTITPSGSVSDGNGGSNYAVTFAPVTTGEITTRPITVSAVTDSKTYDGTTASSATPIITSGSLLAGDSASFSQSFDTRDAGTGKTITPTGSIDDGNDGGNYTITFAPVNTGAIEAMPITVSAATDSKTYDGAAASSGTPAITTGALVNGDTASFTQTFDNRNVGEGKTITPSGAISDGNNGANYTITFASVTDGAITARPITVTAVTAHKTYNGTVSASGTPAITSGALVNGDSASFTQAFDNPNVGSGKTITPSGAISDGNNGGNYAITFVAVNSGSISARQVTITAEAKTKAYGAADPELTYTISPALVNGDSMTGKLARAAGSNAGVYPILQGTLSAGANYTVTYVGANLTIAPIGQTITVATSAPATALLGSSFNVAATSSSGLAVSYSAGGSCSNDGAAFTMTSETGECYVMYDQPGNTNYTAAAQVVETVTAGGAPAVTADPVDVAIIHGEDAVFNAQASGNPVPDVQWQFSTDNGATFQDLDGEQSTTLTLSAPTIETSSTLYRAVFTNIYGSATSQPAKLQISQQTVNFNLFISVVTR